MTASGDLVTLSREGDGDRFKGAVVCLGALGVVVRMTLDLLLSYQARVTIVHCEVSPDVQAAQNRGRERRVPEAVIPSRRARWSA